jgi:YVTN family beta-propeller protein
LLVERNWGTKQWQETITRMGRYAATMPQKDIEPLARYLAGAARATVQSTVAYVADEDLNEVLVIDAESGKLPSQVSVGNAPHGITITPDGSRAYVSNMGSHDVSVIDLKLNQVMCQLSFLLIIPSGSIFTSTNTDLHL